MSIKNRFTAGRLSVGLATLPVEGFGIAPNLIAQHLNHSGLINSAQVLVAGNDLERLTCRVPLAVALSTFGLTPTEQTDLAAVFARTESGLIVSGATHPKYDVASSALAWIDEFSVAEGGAAVATVAVDAFSADGDAEPWTKSAAAFPALSAMPVHHGIGPAQINGSAIPQVTGVSYRSGLSVSGNRVSGLTKTAGGVISGMQQELTIDVSDVQTAWDALGGSGSGVASSTTVQLYRYDPQSGALSSTGGLTFTVTDGYASIESNDADHGQIGSGRIIIRAVASDGSSSGITF